MTLLPTRKNAVKSLRKRDLSDALENLNASEHEFRKIETEILALMDRKKSIRRELGEGKGNRIMLAGALEQGMIYTQGLVSELGRLDLQETEFGKHLEKASKLVDGLKDAVTKAKRALDSLEDERTWS